MSTFVLPKNLARGRIITKIESFLGKLPTTTAWHVEVKPYQTKRSLSQNSFLWGVVYQTILKSGELQGWDSDDLHTYLLGEHFGWETITGFGRKRMRPIRRSSKLSTTDFMGFVAFIQLKMAELGIYIPDPNEYRT